MLAGTVPVSNWCQNNIITNYSDDYCSCLGGGGGGVSYVPLIVEDSGHSISELGKISHNYFGDSGILILPENQPIGTGCNDTFNRGTPSSWIVGDSSPVVANGFCYFADSNYTTWQSRPDSAVDCNISLPLPFTKTKKLTGPKTLSILTDTSCQEKYNIGNADVYAGNFFASDSVLMEYIETCYDTSGAYIAFYDLNGYGYSHNPNPTSYANFREWLKSVLWLGPMYPGWYCSCADDILESYNGIDAGDSLNNSLAILRYLDSSGRCNFDAEDSQILQKRYMNWIDTVNALHHGDTIDFPQDTTLPTIDEIGMGILRSPPAGVQNDTTPSTGITNLTASDNPFSKETTISFTMGEYAYISFQVYDVLGRVVQGDYKGSVQGPGEYSFNIDGTNLPTGTYYARITTPTGITRTIKLVKE